MVSYKMPKLFGYEIATPISLRVRAIQSHGKVCAIETCGPKHSLILSVFGEYNGTRYILRSGVHRGGREILNHLVRA